MQGLSNLFDFPNLGGQVKSKREEFLASNGDIPIPTIDPLTPASRQTIKVEEYAMSSLMVEVMCEFIIQTSPPNFRMPDFATQTESWWKCYALLMHGHERHESKRLLDLLKSRVANSDEDKTVLDRALQRFHTARITLHPEHEKPFDYFPSTSDLINFGIPLIRVVEDLFQKTFSREIRDEELYQILMNGGVREILTEAQVNAKIAVIPLSDLLFGVLQIEDFDDPERIIGSVNYDYPQNEEFAFHRMNLEMFEFFSEDEVPKIRIKPEILTLYREKTEMIFEMIGRYKTRKGEPVERMNCPIVFTKQFKPLYKWFLQMFFKLRYGDIRAKELFAPEEEKIQSWCSVEVKKLLLAIDASS